MRTSPSGRQTAPAPPAARSFSVAGRHQSADVKTAQRLLVDLAKRLETEHPSAAESGREGLDETLTVLTLSLSALLRRSLATTNAAESLLSRTRQVTRNVKRWRNGQMMLRW
jgi:transposase-like protein